MENQQLNQPAAPGESCGAATTSLVLGIFAVFIGPLCGIPAVIAGHIALSKIKKSGGWLQGQGKAIAGLILGYIFTILLPLLAALAFAGTQSAMKKAREAQTRNLAFNLSLAITNYSDEYGSLPVSAASATPISTNSSEGISLLQVLLAQETGRPTLNARGIRFLEVKIAKSRKGGIEYGPDGLTVIGMFDPWGEPFHIALDDDGNDEIVNPDQIDAQDPSILIGFKAVVYSAGADRKLGTKDDITTWRD